MENVVYFTKVSATEVFESSCRLKVSSVSKQELRSGYFSQFFFSNVAGSKIAAFPKENSCNFPCEFCKKKRKKELVTECILEQVCTVLQETGSSNLYLILLFRVIC